MNQFLDINVLLMYIIYQIDPFAHATVSKIQSKTTKKFQKRSNMVQQPLHVKSKTFPGLVTPEA